MGDLQVAVTILGLFAIVLLVVFAACHFLGLWTWTAAWFNSTREEKIGLTRSKGHYNANGYLVRQKSYILTTKKTVGSLNGNIKPPLYISMYIEPRNYAHTFYPQYFWISRREFIQFSLNSN